MMDETDQGIKRSGLHLLVVGLWAATSAVCFLEILTVRGLVVRIYAHLAATGRSYGPDYFGGATLSTLTTLAMAIVCIVIIIGGGEYHYRNVGKPESWKLFGWTIAFELSILVLALFI